MPLVDIQVIEGVFDAEEKKKMIEKHVMLTKLLLKLLSWNGFEI